MTPALHFQPLNANDALGTPVTTQSLSIGDQEQQMHDRNVMLSDW